MDILRKVGKANVKIEFVSLLIDNDDCVCTHVLADCICYLACVYMTVFPQDTFHAQTLDGNMAVFLQNHLSDIGMHMLLVNPL